MPVPYNEIMENYRLLLERLNLRLQKNPFDEKQFHFWMAKIVL